MKLKEGFVIHESDGESLMIAVGEMAERFHGLVRSNRTASFMIDCLKKETTPEAIAEAVTDRFAVDRQTADRDVARVLDQLREIEALDE